MPSLEDFERQLERSIECIAAAREDTIFDRCPADLLAYLITHPDSAGFELEHWRPRVHRASQRFDRGWCGCGLARSSEGRAGSLQHSGLAKLVAFGEELVEDRDG